MLCTTFSLVRVRTASSDKEGGVRVTLGYTYLLLRRPCQLCGNLESHLNKTLESLSLRHGRVTFFFF